MIEVKIDSIMYIQDENINAKYCPAKKSFWQGRESNPDIENQYWYQEIKLIDAENEHVRANVAILGYVCDEGVRRNRGRIGASEGPKAIRERLAKLPVHFDGKIITDLGDVVCIDDDMEACQILFSNYIYKIIKQGVFPIGIGGGHDMAYAHFIGINKAIKNTGKIGIINFDAHFDLRSIEQKANSGTPFNQILTEFNDNVRYFAIGIQQQSNTKELFRIAKNKDVEFVINYDCESSSVEMNLLKNKLNVFIDNVDYLYITIDMDGFSSAYAPGVSAPSPLGFTPYFIFKVLSFLLKTKKVISFDIAELNPSLDRDNLTANLAAKIIDFIVMNV